MVIWRDAKENCKEMGGELIRVTSSGMLDFVGKIISANVWISLNDIAEPGNRSVR